MFVIFPARAGAGAMALVENRSGKDIGENMSKHGINSIHILRSYKARAAAKKLDLYIATAPAQTPEKGWSRRKKRYYVRRYSV